MLHILSGRHLLGKKKRKLYKHFSIRLFFLGERKTKMSFISRAERQISVGQFMNRLQQSGIKSKTGKAASFEDLCRINANNLLYRK